jgi:tryptophan-rich sensory protein
MFDSTLEVCAFIVSFIPTLLAFFGQSFRTDNIYRYFSDQIPGAPPSWLFGVAWGLLYPIRDYGFFCVITTDVEKYQTWIILWLVQSLLLLLWPQVFTEMLRFTTAFVIILAAWGIGIAMTAEAFLDSFYKPAISQLALVLWLTFAAYLNIQSLKFNDIVYRANLCRERARAEIDRECIAQAKCQ